MTPDEEQAALQRLRTVCLAFPEVEERFWCPAADGVQELRVAPKTPAARVG